jgi:outer membrane protein OmpA-like peptidoglycan-associated protein
VTAPLPCLVRPPARRCRRRHPHTCAVLAAALTLAACSSAPADSPKTGLDLRHSGSEAGVAVTVPDGAETLPDWDRRDGTATLVIPSDLLFAKGAAVLDPAAISVLAQVVAEVRSRPAGRPAAVLVEGYADGDGDAAQNQALSERRAGAVAAWLAANGVPADTITTAGWGETRPAVEETDEASKAANRRVVITVGA